MTEDENTPKRPNAKYKLTKGDDGKNPYGEGIVFHYNRERRLEKAPQAVRELYEESKTGRFGFFKSLTGDKSRLITFAVIVVTCIVVYSLSFMGKLDNTYTLEGNKIEITGARIEDTITIMIKKTVKNENSSVYTGAVDIAVSPVVKDASGDFPVYYHRVFFSLDPVQEYRITVPFDSTDLLAILQSERNTLNIRFTVD